MVRLNEIQADRLLSRDEVQELFGFPSKRFLELAAHKGDGPPMIRIGRVVRYRLGDILDWIDAHRVRSTSERNGS